MTAGAGCLRAPPPHPRALENNEYCAQYLSSGNLEKAEVHCDLGLSFSPEYSDLYVNKGLIALRRGQDDVAKELFLKALRHNQEQAQAYSNLGYIHLKRQEYGRAHDYFQRALKVNPDMIEARYNLALTFMKMGKKAAARKEYQTLVAINPNLADPHHDLGLLALEDKALEEAISELSIAVSLDPKFANAWMSLGAAYSEAGKYAEAKDAFTSCLEADPENVPCRNNITLVNQKVQLLDPTLKQVQEAQQTENTPAALYALGLAYRDRGLRNEEERTYKKCVRLDAKYPMCHYGLFLLFKEDRRDKEAAIACKNFVKFAHSEELPSEYESCERYLASDAF